jgi:hypothetical protein
MTNLPQERLFQIQLKNDSVIEFKFSPIAATGDNLWQMFATTEALNTLEQLIRSTVDVTETKSARKKSPDKKK